MFNFWLAVVTSKTTYIPCLSDHKVYLKSLNFLKNQKCALYNIVPNV